MRSKDRARLIVIASTGLVCMATAVLAAPLGTAVTYQGQLKNNAQPANGTFNLTFTLWDAAGAGNPPVGGNQIGAVDNEPNTPVSDGLFTVQLNDANQFGSSAFNGDARWLQIVVNGTTLSPRQPLTAAPYAMGVRLPLAQTVQSSSPAIDIRNTGTGRAAYFQSNNASASVSTLRVDANSTNAGLSAISGVNTGNGYGGYFEIINPANASPALFCTTNGTGPAFLGEGDVWAHGILESINPVDPTSVAFLGWGVDGGGTDVALLRVGGNGPGAANGFDIRRPGEVSLMRIRGSGNVGIGTTDPFAKLHVNGGDMRVQNGADTLDISQNSLDTAGDGFFGDPLYLNLNSPESVLIGFGGGNCGIGGGAAGLPLVPLHVDGGVDANLTTPTSGYFLIGASNAPNIVMDNNEIMARDNSAASSLLINREGGDVIIGSASGGTSTLSTPVLQITGGSDLSENFDVTTPGDTAAQAGMVVCIDAVNPGKLTPCTRDYDPTVAGVISGAGGVKTGMLMGQAGTLADGEHPVALTGRVYVLCDATQQPIAAGDMLTTSCTPGHAMKAADRERAHGAVLGKAMTALQRGQKGLVLVLVNLQ